jgi:hypothetical protein
MKNYNVMTIQKEDSDFVVKKAKRIHIKTCPCGETIFDSIYVPNYATIKFRGTHSECEQFIKNVGAMQI